MANIIHEKCYLSTKILPGNTFLIPTSTKGEFNSSLEKIMDEKLGCTKFLAAAVQENGPLETGTIISLTDTEKDILVIFLVLVNHLENDPNNLNLNMHKALSAAKEYMIKKSKKKVFINPLGEGYFLGSTFGNTKKLLNSIFADSDFVFVVCNEPGYKFSEKKQDKKERRKIAET